MGNRFSARLRAYAPNGGVLGTLPFPLSWEASAPLNDMPGLTLSYPRVSPAVAYLDSPCEVALELRSPTSPEYVEYPNCRFLNLRRSHDMIARPGEVSFTMPSYGWQLQKAHFSNKENLDPKTKKRAFKDATVGTIMKAVIDEAQDEGSIQGVAYDFTGTLDSAGVAWGTSVLFTGDFDLGQDAWNILDTLSRQGFCDWRMNQRTLQMYRPDTFLARSFATDSGIILQPRTSHIQEPAERTWEELASRAIVLGDEDTSIVVDAISAEQPWGQWETTLQAAGVKDVGTLRSIAQRYLDGRNKSRLQLTKELIWRPGTPAALIDYRPGDYLYARTEDVRTAEGGNQQEPVRIHQVTLSSADQYGIITHLTLNDRFMDRDLRNERWLNRVTGRGGPTGGSGSGGSGSGPIPPDPAIRQAAPPTDPAAISNSYFAEDGSPVAKLTVTFDVTTTDTTGLAMDVSFYNVYARRVDLPLDLAIIGTVEHPFGVPAGTRLTAIVGPVDAGFEHEIAVQAVPNFGRPSDWSTTVNLTPTYPVQPLPKPSTPILSSRLGTVKAEWDGFDSVGERMPAQFSEIQVQLALVAAGPWTNVGDILQPNSSVIISGQDSQLEWSVGDTLYVRFNARDRVSNFSSEPSDVASIEVIGVVGPDIEANSITANEIAAGTITAEEIAAHSLTVDRLSVGDPRNFVADPLLSDLGDPDPNNPGQTVGGLNRHRIVNSQLSSAGATQWTIVGGTAVMTNGITGDTFNRFSLINNVKTNINLAQNGAAPPGGTMQVTRPTGATGNSGNMRGRFRVAVSGNTAPGLIQVGMYINFYDRSGNFIVRSAMISVRDFTAAEDIYLQSVTGSVVPEGAAGFIPYVYIGCTGGVPVGVTVTSSEFEVWQEGSVEIGDGMIRAPLIAANAITTDKLDALAITAKHTISSAHYIMTSESGGQTVEISSSANYVNQAGIRFNPGITSMQLHPAIFIADNGGTGGWDPNALVLMGPEQIVNNSGRVCIQLAYGVTNSVMVRYWGPNMTNQQGIRWVTSDARFLITGKIPTGQYDGDMFRPGRFTAATGRNTTWSAQWGGSSTWTFYPTVSPAAANSPGIPNCIPSFVTSRTVNGFTANTKVQDITGGDGASNIHWFSFAGGA